MAIRSSTKHYQGSTWRYYTIPWLYLSLLDTIILYHGSTQFYWTLIHSTIPVPIFYWTLLPSTMALHTGLYYTSPWIYLPPVYSTTLFLLHTTVALVESTTIYHGSTALYNTLQFLCMDSSTWLSLQSTIAQLSSTKHYYTLPLHYLAVLDSTTLHYGSTCAYFTLYYNLPCLYLTLLHPTIVPLEPTAFYNGSIGLY